MEDDVIRGLVALALAVAAAAVLTLAWQVHRWQSRLAADDLRFEVAPTTAGLWRSPSGAGSGVAKRILGVGDDVEFRRAEQLFVNVHVGARTYVGEQERLAAFGQAQSNLEKLSRADPAPGRRSRAANLLGILLWENASSADENAPVLLGQSMEALKRAIRASAGADEAKYNLEVLQTVLEPRSERRDDAPEEAGGGGFKGAGIAGPGKGY